MNHFDDKQKKLILSWHDLSEKSEDYYMAFMSEWIAFNAICYNLFYEKATLERADIDRKKSKIIKLQEMLNENPFFDLKDIKLEARDGKWSIDIRYPERLFLSISKKYTEDMIFERYVDSYKKDLEQSNELVGVFEDLKNALKKGNNRHYVINMARIKDYKTSKNIDEMAEQRIVILCETNGLKTIKNVLYQIRCNIFHGEKTPGDMNDDRIVKSALPILKHIVNDLITRNSIQTNS